MKAAQTSWGLPWSWRQDLPWSSCDCPHPLGAVYLRGADGHLWALSVLLFTQAPSGARPRMDSVDQRQGLRALQQAVAFLFTSTYCALPPPSHTYTKSHFLVCTTILFKMGGGRKMRSSSLKSWFTGCRGKGEALTWLFPFIHFYKLPALFFINPLSYNNFPKGHNKK